MHQMVQPQLDHVGPHHGHSRQDYSSHSHRHHLSQTSPSFHGTDSTPRVFALRNAQHVPALHRITTSFTRMYAHDQAEHSLRRKTPNGTIDNGYDGSLTHMASGPPPLKHMIVPASSKMFPTPTAVVYRASAQSIGGPLQQPQVGAWPYPAATPTAQFDFGAETLNSLPGAPRGWGTRQSSVMLDLGADGASFPQPHGPQQHSYHAVSGLQPLLGPGYHQPIPRTVYSYDGYQQPYRTSIPLANGYTPQNSVESAFMASQATINQGFANVPGLGQAHNFGLPLPSHPLDDGFARYSQNHLVGHAPHFGWNAPLTAPAAGYLAKVAATGEASSPARFRERALQNAHKTYNDLLLYLTSAKKANHARRGSGSRLSPKMVVYPKPSSTAACTGGRVRTFPGSLESMASYSQQMAQKEAAVRAFARTQSLGDNGVVLGGHGQHRNPYSSSHHARPYHEVGSPVLNARSSLDMLSTLCEQSGWKWIEGMLLGGCLHYGLEHYDDALEWFKRIVNLDARCVTIFLFWGDNDAVLTLTSHVEAISNIAATLYCLNRQEEAEQHWVQAIKLRPSYLEAVEHLVSLLCSMHRNEEAVNTITFIQRALRMPGLDAPLDQAGESASEADTASTTTIPESSPDPFLLDSDRTDSPEQRFASTAEDGKAPGFGSSGYAIPGSENGRMILLIHAKGNMLYSLKDIDRASDAFEEVVRISAGRQVQGVQSLIRRVQSVLAPRDPGSGQRLGSVHKSPSTPLLLPPAKAKATALFVFSSTGGQLPGLRHMPEGTHKKSVVATTSNSLLSLAKIFQDAMSNGGSNSGLIRQPAGVGDILSLYYLSLSLQESPSTANNVGILLAGIQQSASAHDLSVSDLGIAASVPGIVPGSGLSLALAYYQYGLTLDPRHVHLHTNLGSLLKDIGQLDMAISMYEQAVACDGSFDIALTNLANAVKDRGRVGDAIKYYQRAVVANPDFAEAVCGLSTALNSVCDWRGRGGVVLAGGKYDRWHVDEKGMLRDVKAHGQGGGLMNRVVGIVGRQLKESSSWGCGVLQQQSILQLVVQLRDAGAGITDASLDLEVELRNWAGRPGEGYRILRLIERSTSAAMRCWYRDKHIKGIQSPAGYRRPKPPASLSMPSAPTVLPFHTFTAPLPAKDVRMISQRNALRISFSTLRAPWIPATVYEPPDPPSPHLNVGYVSSDFNNHPLAHL